LEIFSAHKNNLAVIKRKTMPHFNEQFPLGEFKPDKPTRLPGYDPEVKIVPAILRPINASEVDPASPDYEPVSQLPPEPRRSIVPFTGAVLTIVNTTSAMVGSGVRPEVAIPVAIGTGVIAIGILRKVEERWFLPRQ
jgi:hypothetical protein